MLVPRASAASVAYAHVVRPWRMPGSRIRSAAWFPRGHLGMVAPGRACLSTTARCFSADPSSPEQRPTPTPTRTPTPPATAARSSVPEDTSPSAGSPGRKLPDPTSTPHTHTAVKAKSTFDAVGSLLRKPKNLAATAIYRTQEATRAVQELTAASRARAQKAWQRAQAHPVVGPVVRLLARIWVRLMRLARSMYQKMAIRLASRPAAQHTQLALAAERQVAGKLSATFGLERHRAAVALALALAAATATLTLPWAAGGLVDAYANLLSEPTTPSGAGLNQDPAQSGGIWGSLSLPVVGTFLLTLLAIRAGGQTGSTLLFQLASIRTTARLRTAIADRLLLADAPWAQSHGRLAARMANKDIAILASSLQKSYIPLVCQGTVAAGSAVALLSSAPSLALILAVMVPALSRATYVYERFLTSQVDDVSALRQSVATSLEHALPPSTAPAEMEATRKDKDHADRATYFTMKRLGKEEEVSASLHRHVDALAHAEGGQAQAWGIYSGGAGLVGNGVALALLGYGGLLVARGILTPGALVSLSLYTALLGQSLPPTRTAYTETANGLAAAKRIFDLLQPDGISSRTSDLPSGPVQQPPKSYPSVRFLQVSTSKGAEPILNRVDFAIPGETSAVILVPSTPRELEPGVGPSVFDLVQGLACAREGQIDVDGSPRTSADLRKAFVTVEAIPSFDPKQTIAEAITSGTQPGSRLPSSEELDHAVQWAQCEDLCASPGLEARTDVLNTASANWRVGLARALARIQVQIASTPGGRAPVLLLDVRAVERAVFSCQPQADQGSYLVAQAIKVAQQSLHTPVWVVSSCGMPRNLWLQLQPYVVVLSPHGDVVQSGTLDAVDVPGSVFQTMLAQAQIPVAPARIGSGQTADLHHHHLDLAGLRSSSGPFPPRPSPAVKPQRGQQTITFHSSAIRRDPDILAGRLEAWSVASATAAAQHQKLAASEIESLHLASYLAPPGWPSAPAAPEGLDEMAAMFDSVRERDQSSHLNSDGAA